MMIRPRVYCNDGVSLSIQAGKSKYCTPRDDDGPYWTMEVGFIRDANGVLMAPPESWAAHSDGPFPSSIYGYVPVEMIDAFIAEHGGKKESGTIDGEVVSRSVGKLTVKENKEVAE